MLVEPKCSVRGCIHFLGVKYHGEGEESEDVVCEAFPTGIPSEIAYGDDLHIEPYLGDNGIQFEGAK